MWSSSQARRAFQASEQHKLVIRGPLVLRRRPCWDLPDNHAVQRQEKDNGGAGHAGLSSPYQQEQGYGVQQSGQQAPIRADWIMVTSLSEGRFRLEFNAGNFGLAGLGTVAQAGNYIFHEGNAGGVALWSNQGVTFEQVTAYGGGGVWGLWETGLNKFVQWRSLRRPGTNRLYAGGGAFQVRPFGPVQGQLTSTCTSACPFLRFKGCCSSGMPM